MADYFTIRSPQILQNCFAAIREAGWNARVTIAPAQRSNDQNAKFHAICSDLAKSGLKWAGKERTLEQWKVLLVSGHTKATDGEVEFVPGLEGEFVNIRESTSRMGVARASSLIEYALAYCAMNGVELSETRKGGWMDEVAA
jgi:hypothetical protein